jgi:hypothetical protein
VEDDNLEVTGRSIYIGEQTGRIILSTALGMITISTVLHLGHDGILNRNSDARHVCAISEAAVQYRFYNKTDNELEVFNAFTLLVVTKHKYRDVLEELPGDGPAMNLQAPAAGMSPTAKIQTLAGGLASSLVEKQEASAANESKHLPGTLLQWALREGNRALMEILSAMKGAVATAEFLQSQDLPHDAT